MYKLKRINQGLCFILASLMLFSCNRINMDEKSDLKENSLIPAPVEVIPTGEWFLLNSNTAIKIIDVNKALLRSAEFFQQQLKEGTGIEPEILPAESSRRSNLIVFQLEEDPLQGEEGYSIVIGKKKILVSASRPAGIYRATQSLRQLIQLDGRSIEAGKKGMVLAAGSIMDAPEYAYRSTMLDVSRHFFDVETVKKYIDLISIYKINHLHLHLSDDQGWRIEIKTWPKLTEIGGSTEVGGGEGGFYTQEAYAEIVKYAAERYITIIPEIDMPGHTNAALASYPELNCSGIAPGLYTGTRVGFSTLCTDKEITYRFVDDVIRELADLTPGPYIHIGGDESHVTAIEDYIPFIERVQDIVHKHGKNMIGWDEITHASLKGGTIAQYWASSENALRGISQGSRIIMSPATRCYLDMKYNESSPLGLNWAAYIELDSAYLWNPSKLVDGINREDILGIESPLWGETIETMEDIEYLAFPRLIGHSEIGWSGSEMSDWESYRKRLSLHGKLLDKMNVNYYRSPLIDW